MARTLTIDTVSESGAWVRELWHRQAQGMKPPTDVPAIDEETEHHGELNTPNEGGHHA